MTLYLAYSKEGALQTLEDLDAFLTGAKKGDNFAFDTCNGEYSYEGFVSSELGTKSLNFYHDGAGIIYLAQYELLYISDPMRREYPDDAQEPAED